MRSPPDSRPAVRGPGPVRSATALGALVLARSAVAAPEVNAGAVVSATARVATSGCAADFPGGCAWLDFHDAAVFAPWAEARPDPRVMARGAVDLRLHGPTALASVEDSGDPAAVQPWSARIRDAWVGTRTRHLDLQVGAQRIAWGTGVGISVVDNVNPWDLEDPTRFDRRLGTLSAAATAHGGAWSLQVVAAPFFVPAALPVEQVDLTASAGDLFDAEATGAGEVEVGELESRIRLPPDDLSETALAARLRWTPAWGDLALSWYHGRDSLPQVDGEVVLTGFSTDADRVDVGVPVTWPRLDVGGFEARGELWQGISGWAELAVVLLERTVATTSERQLEALEHLGTIDSVPDPLPSTVTQDGDPYLRWLVGADRSLGPLYLNLQWLRGFPTERQRADLGDYLLANLRWTVTPTVRLQAGGALDLKRAQGGLGNAEVDWLFADAAELGLGATLVSAPDGTALAGFRRVSHLRAGVRMSF